MVFLRQNISTYISWDNAEALISVSVVAVHRAGLVLGWATLWLS